MSGPPPRLPRDGVRADQVAPSRLRRLRMMIVVAGLLAPLSRAAAHKGGIAAPGCEGCHSGGKPATVTLTATPMQPAIGQAVSLTISVSQTNGSVAGFYLTTLYGSGTFKATEAGTAIADVMSGGVLHTTPRTGSGGQTVFHAGWSSSTMAGVVFQVYALSANGDGTNRGDGPGQASLALAAGCGAGKTYYLDQDGDGFGTSDLAYPTVVDCSTPVSYSANATDCDDFHETVFPGAAEICDGKDNDCNGKIDDASNAVLCGVVGGTCNQGKCSNGTLGTGGAVGTGGASATGGVKGTGGQSAATGGANAGGQANGGRATGGGRTGGLSGGGGGPAPGNEEGRGAGGCAVVNASPSSPGDLGLALSVACFLLRRRRLQASRA